MHIFVYHLYLLSMPQNFAFYSPRFCTFFQHYSTINIKAFLHVYHLFSALCRTRISYLSFKIFLHTVQIFTGYRPSFFYISFKFLRSILLVFSQYRSFFPYLIFKFSLAIEEIKTRRTGRKIYKVRRIHKTNR